LAEFEINIYGGGFVEKREFFGGFAKVGKKRKKEVWVLEIKLVF